MSVLEFVAALKWPITLLILVLLVAIAVKRSSPETREQVVKFITDRNFRLKVGPNELEALRADTEAEMKVAVAPDAALAAAIGSESPNGAKGDPSSAIQGVGALRREVVEAVMRSSARWGWEMARSGTYLSLPNPVVRWTESGRPVIGLRTPAEEIARLDEIARNQEVRRQELYDKINLDYALDAEAEMRGEVDVDD